MPELKFREMEEKDLKEILPIERQSFPTPWSYGLFLHEMANSLAGTMVAEMERDDGVDLVGYACFWRIGEEIHITNIAIHPSCRRQGMGERMLVHIMEAAREENIEAITLEVRVSNAAARRMYEKLGFVSTGLRKRYYPDNGEDAVIMTLEGLR